MPKQDNRHAIDIVNCQIRFEGRSAGVTNFSFTHNKPVSRIKTFNGTTRTYDGVESKDFTFEMPITREDSDLIDDLLMRGRDDEFEVLITEVFHDGSKKKKMLTGCVLSQNQLNYSDGSKASFNAEADELVLLSA